MKLTFDNEVRKEFEKNRFYFQKSFILKLCREGDIVRNKKHLFQLLTLFLCSMKRFENCFSVVIAMPYKVSSFEVSSFEVYSFEVCLFEMFSFEVFSFEVRSF